MTKHMTGTRKEWLAARLELLEAEKELTRRCDELARRRQELPWVRVDKEYRFETDEGSASRLEAKAERADAKPSEPRREPGFKFESAASVRRRPVWSPHQSVSSNAKRKASPSATMRPADGSGKWAVQISVSVSQ